MNLTSLSSLWCIEPLALAGMQSLAAHAPRREGITAQSSNQGRHYGFYETVSGVAIIPIRGVLVRRETWLSEYFDEVGMERLTEAITKAAGNDAVRSILLRVDSPGGTVDGLAELVDAVWSAREQKRVIAQVEGTAASAAYHVASQAHEIYAQRMDVVGSIGSRMMLYDFSAAFEAAGVKAIPIDTGWFKSAGEYGTEITDEQIAEFQRLVDAFQADFLKAVRRGRNMTAAQLKPLADGRVFLASEAVSNGLIDGIRTLGDTLDRETRRKSPAAMQRETWQQRISLLGMS